MEPYFADYQTDWSGKSKTRLHSPSGWQSVIADRFFVAEHRMHSDNVSRDYICHTLGEDGFYRLDGEFEMFGELAAIQVFSRDQTSGLDEMEYVDITSDLRDGYLRLRNIAWRDVHTHLFPFREYKSREAMLSVLDVEKSREPFEHSRSDPNRSYFFTFNGRGTPVEEFLRVELDGAVFTLRDGSWARSTSFHQPIWNLFRKVKVRGDFAKWAWDYHERRGWRIYLENVTEILDRSDAND